MTASTPEQVTTDSESLLREWDALPKDDPAAVLEHLAKLRTLAAYLNAQLGPPQIPTA
jgi:hypothetical protein